MRGLDGTRGLAGERVREEVYRREKKSDYNRRYYQRKKARNATDSPNEKKVLWSGRIRESVLARIYRMVNESIATGKYPWKTATETVENLILRGFTTLKGDPVVDEMMPSIEMMQHLDRIHQLRRESQAILNRAKEEIAELLGIGADAGAVRYFHVTMEAAQKMPPTEWRDWLIAQLAQTFPDLKQEKATGVSLKPGTPQKKTTGRGMIRKARR